MGCAPSKSKQTLSPSKRKMMAKSKKMGSAHFLTLIQSSLKNQKSNEKHLPNNFMMNHVDDDFILKQKSISKGFLSYFLQGH